LLTELNANQNISLLLKYHYRIGVQKAHDKVLDILKECRYEKLSDKRLFELNKKERFIIQFIRAYVSKFDKIAIIKPFSMLSHREDLSEILSLSSILSEKEIEILDTRKYDFYKDKKCLIIK